MPTRAPRPCSRPGCRALTSSRHCERHAAEHTQRERARRAESEAHRPTAAARGYGVDWQALRKQCLARDPFCVMCAKLGVRKPSRHADHIVPKRAGGRDELANLQGICWSHHSRKTASEDGGFGNPVVPGDALTRAAQLRAAAERRSA